MDDALAFILIIFIGSMTVDVYHIRVDIHKIMAAECHIKENK